MKLEALFKMVYNRNSDDDVSGFLLFLGLSSLNGVVCIYGRQLKAHLVILLFTYE
jgi:hypothetical protein